METIDTVENVEEGARALRLAEQAFFRSVLQNIKEKYRERIFQIVLALSFLVLIGGIFACPLLKLVGLCPWGH